MDSIQYTVYYCCVSKGGRIMYSHSNGDREIEKMAELCLERAPPHHMWYFQTMGKKTFGFLMKDGHIYFAIVDDALGNPGVLRFLENMRDEFRKLAKRGSNRSMSNLNSLGLQEQLVPVIRHLITSLERVSETSTEWPSETPSPHQPSPYNNTNGQTEAGGSTKAPLLGNKSSKQEKRKMKDHVVAMRDIELEEHRRSIDRGVKVELGSSDSNNQGGSMSAISLQKDSGSMRIRATSQSVRNKWCRLVRIILVIDAAVCLVLFAIWLVICRGIECLR
ncbi:hypothetical protein LguiB_010342 [Lonicera macranthoides]